MRNSGRKTVSIFERKPDYSVLLGTTRGPHRLAGPLSADEAKRIADERHSELFETLQVPRLRVVVDDAHESDAAVEADPLEPDSASDRKASG